MNCLTCAIIFIIPTDFTSMFCDFTNNVIPIIKPNGSVHMGHLKDLGLAIHLETSGAYPMSGSFDWICISPKKNQDSLLDILKIADELKIIVHNKNDLKWAKNKQNSVSKSCKLYLQPEWKMKNKVMPYITDFIMENIQWEVSLQTHKYMNLP